MNKDLSVFQIISDFVGNLTEYFSDNNHARIKPLKLYNRLVSKMSLDKKDVIQKHISVFKSYCKTNRMAIRNRDKDMMMSSIVFSKKIYIDMEYIFKYIDNESEHVVWEYLLSISAFLDPENNTRDLLKDKRKNTSQPDMNGMSNMLGMLPMLMNGLGGGLGDLDIEGLMSGKGDMSSMIEGLLNSPVFSSVSDKFEGCIEDGKIDIKKMMAAVKELMGDIREETSNNSDPQLQMLMNMLPNLDDLESKIDEFDKKSEIDID